MAETKTATTPATPTAPEAKPAKRGTLDLEQFDSVEKATEAVKDRVKGHRRVFTVTHDGKSEVYVASHPAFVGQYMFQKLGGSIQEAGKVGRAAAKPVGVEAIMAAIANLPETEKAAVTEQLAILTGKKPAKK